MRAYTLDGIGASRAAAVGLAGVGCVLVLLGTFIPYVSYPDGTEYAVFDFDHLGTTWSGGLSSLVAAGAIPAVGFLARRHPALFGAFAIGTGIVVFLDFLGAFVIGPTTYSGSADLHVGGVLGAVGGGLLVAAGAVATATGRSDVTVSPVWALASKPDAGAGWWDGVRRLLFAAIAANAILGLATIVFGDFGQPSDLAAKLLGSSLAVTGGILTALACGSALRRTVLWPIPVIGIGVSAVGFGLLVAEVWGQWASEQFLKITASVVVAALGCAWASLVSIARLPALHPLRIGTIVLVFAFDVAGVAAIWALTSNTGFWRAFGSIGLVLLAATSATVVATSKHSAIAVDSSPS